jgi:hypothetical protein
MNIAIPFRPKLFETLKNYSGALFRRDFAAGLNAMVMAVPATDRWRHHRGVERVACPDWRADGRVGTRQRGHANAGGRKSRIVERRASAYAR